MKLRLRIMVFVGVVLLLLFVFTILGKHSSSIPEVKPYSGLGVQSLGWRSSYLHSSDIFHVSRSGNNADLILSSRSSHALYRREVLFLPAKRFFFVPINHFLSLLVTIPSLSQSTTAFSNRPLLSLVPISRSPAGANATKGESEMGTDPWGSSSNYFWARRMPGLSLSSAGSASRS